MQALYLSAGFGDLRMMLRDMIEKTCSYIECRGWLFSFLGFILALLAYISLAWATVWGIIVKITSDTFNIAVLAILFFGAIISLILLTRQQGMNRLREKEKELSILKSNFEGTIGQLKEKTVQYDELAEKYDLGMEKKVQLTGCEITSDDKEKDPKLSITQRFVNMNESSLKLSKVEMLVKADGKELDEFVYNSSGPTLHLEVGKIMVSDMPSLNLNCWLSCETTKLSQAIPDYHGKEIEIAVNGIIEFEAGTVKINKTIDGKKKIPFNAIPYRVIS